MIDGLMQYATDPCAGNPSERVLKNCLATNGLVEYVSIPWECRHSKDEQEPKVLTMNLALWFIHTLAGNAHLADWSYPSLTAEKLTQLPCSHANTGLETPVSQATEARQPRKTRQGSSRSPLLSRKRTKHQSLDESDESDRHDEDPLLTSFNESAILARQVR